MQATGRIVLSLQPGSNDISQIAGMSLEAQDRLIVPARPATVNVLGAVYNANAFMHAEKRRVGDYLRQAGGPTRNADKGRAYIIQADGSVLPKQDLGSSFEKKKLNPGDTVVVPEQVLKSTFMSRPPRLDSDIVPNWNDRRDDRRAAIKEADIGKRYGFETDTGCR